VDFIKTSDPMCNPQWFVLPRPNQMELLYRGGANPETPGTYVRAYSFIDENGHISEMSPTISQTITKRNTNYCVRFDHPLWTRATGLIVWQRRLYDENITNAVQLEWRPAFGQSFHSIENTVVKPFLPMTGFTNHHYRALEVDKCVWYQWAAFENTDYWGPRSTLPAPTNPPIILSYHFPDRKCRTCYSWVGHEGESPRSEPLTHDAIGTDPNMNSPIHLRRAHADQPPQGAHGMRVWVMFDDETEWCAVPTNYDEDEYVWPIMNKIDILRAPNPYIHPSEVVGRSFLGRLERAMNYVRHIIVDTDAIVYSPVISPLQTPYGTVQDRVISGKHGLPFDITIAKNLPACEGGASIPPLKQAWIETGFGTSPRGMKIATDHAEVAVEFMDCSGSGCFSLDWRDVKVDLTKSGYTAGFRQLHENCSKYSHSLSDSIFRNTRVRAGHPIVIEGNQSLNITFDGVLANALGDSIESSIISMHNWGSLKIKDLTCEGGRSIMVANSGIQFEIDGLFTDQGYPCHITLGSGAAPSMKITARKINHWKPWLHLLEQACSGPGVGLLEYNGVESQTNGDVDTLLFTMRYTGFRYVVATLGSLFKALRLQQTSLEKWKQPAGTSFFDTWDAGIDVAGVPPTLNVYGYTPGTIVETP